MTKPKKILLSTLPAEGEFVAWRTPKFFLPPTVKYMPLGILSLASNLPQKYQVKILDPSSDGLTIEQTVKIIEDEKPDVLGLSAVTRRVYALNKILEKTSAPYKAVGGPHATHYAEQILERGADVVFVGNLADDEFRAAVETMSKGVIYCDTKINEINFPKRELLKIDDYFPKEYVLFKAENRLPMFSSIGCPYRCVFCDIQTRKVQRKSPRAIVREMQYLYSLGSGSVHMLDDNFNVDERHLNGILDEMDRVSLNKEWSGRGRARISDVLAKRLSEHNFKRIHVGIESLSDEILKFFRKSLTSREICEFCETMNKYNIDIIAYFIIGTPIDKDDYWQQLPEKIRTLGIKFPYFNMLFPEPNTEYYYNLLKEGVYKKDYWAQYMQNPTPYFEIPYPYGETRKQEVMSCVNGLIDEFKSTKSEQKK